MGVIGGVVGVCVELGVVGFVVVAADASSLRADVEHNQHTEETEEGTGGHVEALFLADWWRFWALSSVPWVTDE